MISKTSPLLHSVLRAAAVLALTGTVFGAKDDAKAPSSKQNAAQLVESAQQSVAYIVKSARAAGEGFDPAKAKAKPFYNALKKVDTSLQDAGKQLAAKDKKFFTSASNAQSATTEMLVTLDLTGTRNAKVEKGAKKLAASVNALAENYTPLAQRKAKGGKLTDAEKTEFAKLQASQKELAAKLSKVSAQAKKNPALAAGIAQTRKTAQAIAKAPATVVSYVDALGALDIVRGWLWGYYWYLPAGAASWWTYSYPSQWNSYYTDAWSSYDYNWASTQSAVSVADSYALDVSAADLSATDSFLDETSFDMSEQESAEVAEESSSLDDDGFGADAADDNVEDMADDDGADDNASTDDQTSGNDGDADTAMDDGGNDDSGDDNSGDDGGSDDGGGDSGGGDDGGGGGDE